MKAGAFDYLAKPVDRDLLATTVRRAVHLRRMRDESRHFRESVLDDVLAHPDAFADIITMNRQMRSIFQYIESIAVSPEPVLITGETGVGKELVATAIHRLSGRPGSLVTVNVAGLDDHVFSDTLFGHRKGAFTGAVEYRAGLIEKAEGGTLLLDEIGDLRNETQVKLLRMLQEGEYFPLGADTVQHSDARIIATTNCDVAALQAQGRFRKDLYYRLHAHHIQLPPLRNRLEDIPCLVQHFLQEAAESMGRKVPTIPPDLKTLLQSYRFPGNIRELRAMIYDAVSSHKSHILSLQRFQDHMQDNRESGTLPDNCRARLESAEVPFPTLREANSQLVLAAMKRANGNQSIAARLLGISQPALSARLKKMKTRNPEDKSI
jgi:DNA-binding NtrC family response regulator